MNDEDFKDNELINIKLTRADYKILENMIKREEAYNWLTAKIKGNLWFVVGSGALTLFLLYDKIHAYLMVK